MFKILILFSVALSISCITVTGGNKKRPLKSFDGVRGIAAGGGINISSRELPRLDAVTVNAGSDPANQSASILDDRGHDSHVVVGDGHGSITSTSSREQSESELQHYLVLRQVIQAALKKLPRGSSIDDLFNNDLVLESPLPFSFKKKLKYDNRSIGFLILKSIVSPEISSFMNDWRKQKMTNVNFLDKLIKYWEVKFELRQDIMVRINELKENMIFFRIRKYFFEDLCAVIVKTMRPLIEEIYNKSLVV